eukprot:m.222545 g.222545  ORF g.222545 m.222545 type:complete len:56 (+) comp22307_c0_seq2:135-302(+)
MLRQFSAGINSKTAVEEQSDQQRRRGGIPSIIVATDLLSRGLDTLDVRVFHIPVE